MLDPDLTVRFVNRAFCDKFSVVPEHTVGRKLYELGNKEWDIPNLRIALETILSGESSFEGFEELCGSLGDEAIRRRGLTTLQ